MPFSSYQDENTKLSFIVKRKLLFHAVDYESIIKQFPINHLPKLTKLVQLIWIILLLILKEKYQTDLKHTPQSQRQKSFLKYFGGTQAFVDLVVENVYLFGLTYLVINFLCLVFQVCYIICKDTAMNNIQCLSAQQDQNSSDHKIQSFWILFLVKAQVFFMFVGELLSVPIMFFMCKTIFDYVTILFTYFQEKNQNQQIQSKAYVYYAIMSISILIKFATMWQFWLGIVEDQRCLSLFRYYQLIIFPLVFVVVCPLNRIILGVCSCLYILSECTKKKYFFTYVIYAQLAAISLIASFIQIRINLLQSELDLLSQTKVRDFSNVEYLYIILSAIFFFLVIWIQSKETVKIGCQDSENSFLFDLISKTKGDNISQQLQEQRQKINLMQIFHSFMIKQSKKKEDQVDQAFFQSHNQTFSFQIDNSSSEDQQTISNEQKNQGYIKYFLEYFSFHNINKLQKITLIQFLRYKLQCHLNHDHKHHSFTSSSHKGNQSLKNDAKIKINDQLLIIQLIILQYNLSTPQSSSAAAAAAVQMKRPVLSQQKLNFIQVIQKITKTSEKIHMSSHSITWKEDYKLVEFSLYVRQQMYRKPRSKLTNKSPLNTLKIIRSAKISEKFYLLASKVFELLENFWKLLLQDYKTQKQIMRAFQKLLKQQQKLQETFIKLSINANPREQKKILKQILKFINGHFISSNQSLSDLLYLKKDAFFKKTNSFESGNAEQNLQQTFFQKTYILLEGDIISRCSFDFLETFGYKEEDCHQEELSMLFPQNFCNYVSQQIRLIGTSAEKSFILPIMSKSKQVFVKRCSIYLFPQVSSSIKTLIIFENIQQEKSRKGKKSEQPALFFYNLKKDIIQIVNRGFIEEFKLDAKKIFTKMTQSKILSHEFFPNCDLASPQSKQFLKEGKVINGEMFTINFATLSTVKQQKSRMQMPKIKVHFSLVQNYQSKNSHGQLRDSMILLKLTKGIHLKTQVIRTEQSHRRSKSICSLTQSCKDYSNHQQNQDIKLADKYKNEKFFCKIRNPYSAKITEKQSQLAEPDRTNNATYLHLFFWISFIAFAAQILFFSIFQSQRIDLYDTHEHFLYQANQQYFLICQLYTQMLKTQALIQNPFLVTTINPRLTLDDFVPILKQSIAQNCQKFLDTYLDTLHYTAKKVKIKYDIKFQYFTVKSDTSKTTLIDFIQRFQLYANNKQSRDFVYKNYPSFRQFNIEFQKLLKSDKIIQEIQQNGQQLPLYLGIVFFLILIASNLCVCQLQMNEREILKILEFITAQQARDILHDIVLTKQNFPDLMSKCKSNETLNNINNSSTPTPQKQQNKIKTLKSLISQRSFYNSNTQNASKKKNNDEFALKNDDDKVVDSQDSQDQIMENKPSESQNKLSLNDEPAEQRKIMFQPFLLFFYRNFWFLMVLVSMTIIFLKQASALREQEQTYNQLFRYQEKMLQAYLAMKRLENDQYFYPGYKKNYNITYDEIDDYYKVQNLSTYFQLPMKDEFKSFKIKQYIFLYGDLCRLQVKDEIPIYGLTCDIVGGMILTKGFSLAYSYMKKVSLYLMHQDYADADVIPCDLKSCPIIMEALYMISKFTYLFTELIQQYRIFYTEVSKGMREKATAKTWQNVSIMLLPILTFWIWIYKLKQNSVKHIRLFNAIPPKIMYNIRVTNFIRKNNILSKLDHL